MAGPRNNERPARASPQPWSSSTNTHEAAHPFYLAEGVAVAGPELVEAPAEKLARLQQMRAEVAALEKRIAAKAPARPRPWHAEARPEQLAPEGDWDIWLYLAGRGTGKALSLDVLIPTPGGWTAMGKLAVGDQVFDETGRPCNVTAVHDIWAETAYRLTFSGGATLDACGDHRWVTWTGADRKAFLRSPYEDTSRMPEDWPNWRLRRMVSYSLPREEIERALELHAAGWPLRKIEAEIGRSRNSLAPHLNAGRYLERVPKVYPDSPGPRVRTTQEIVDTLTFTKRGDTNHSVPVAGALQLPHAVLPVHPYVLGVWLGDGTSASAEITIGDEDLDETTALLAECGEAVRATNRAIRYSAGARAGVRDPKTGRMVSNGGLHSRLKSLGLLKNKHVPEMYLRASAEQRLALLQGLMDSDGYVGANGHVEFTSTKRVLADAVVELAASLGQKPVLGEYRATLYGRDCGPKFRVKWRPTTNVFRLERKRARVKPAGAQGFRNTHRMIVAAERIPAQPMRCITVDSPNHMYLAGEHMIPTHNTRSGAEWLVEQAARTPNSEWAAIAPTWRDCQKTCFEGPSGLVKSLLPGEFESMNMSALQLRLSNGSRIYGYSADRPDRLRGSNLSGAWVDELCTMQRAEDLLGEALMPALRIGEHPRVLITTTPRPVKVIKDLVARTDGSVVVVRGSTWDNAANLSKTALENLRARYEGTRMGRQELEGELLEDIEGALWSRDLLDDTRVDKAPHLARIVVGVDPAVTSGEKSDFTGIVVAGKSPDGHLYILEDLTMKGSPHACMAAAVKAYHRWEADRIVGEVNNGGDYIGEVLRTVDPNVPYKSVRASRGKTVRAEPIAALWEQGRGHIVGVLPALEDQMCSLAVDPTADAHDDRVDAAVWASVELQVGASAMFYLAAISRVCPSCDMPNRKSDAACRGCGGELAA
jgi:phage terminase large subunit-like protein